MDENGGGNNESFSHLSAKAQELLNLSDEARIQRVRSRRWIGYTKAHQVYEVSVWSSQAGNDAA